MVGAEFVMEKKVKKSTDYLRRRGASPVNENFRLQIFSFLETTHADDEIVYFIKKDLSKRIDHPFYGVRQEKPNVTRDRKSVIQEYCRLLMMYENENFSKKMFQTLSSQQEQTLRKLPPKSSIQKSRKKRFGKGVWEHPIPVKYIVENLLSAVLNKDKNQIEKILSIYELAGIVFLSPKENALVNEKFRWSMPENWSWDDANVDPFIRYKLVKIEFDIP